MHDNLVRIPDTNGIFIGNSWSDVKHHYWFWRIHQNMFRIHQPVFRSVAMLQHVAMHRGNYSGFLPQMLWCSDWLILLRWWATLNLLWGHDPFFAWSKEEAYRKCRFLYWCDGCWALLIPFVCSFSTTQTQHCMVLGCKKRGALHLAKAKQAKAVQQHVLQLSFWTILLVCLLEHYLLTDRTVFLNCPTGLSACILPSVWQNCLSELS